MNEKDLKAAEAKLMDDVAGLIGAYQAEYLGPYLSERYEDAEDIEAQAQWLFAQGLRLMMQACDRTTTPKALVAFAEAVEEKTNA